MLTQLSIRDVVLIEKLDLAITPGLTVLTGETGAGKSILLDSLGLALGARADANLVRRDAPEARVTACFAPPGTHPVHAELDSLGIPPEEQIVLRRTLARDGRSRAWINDQPIGAASLRRIGAMLVEVQGQHEQIGLLDTAAHLRLLDAFGTPPELTSELAARHRTWRAAEENLATARAAIAEARREEEFLRHATAELAELAPEEGEEDVLAAKRTHLQQAERRAEAIAAALAELAPRDRRHGGPAANLRAAARALARLLPPGTEEGPAAEALAAITRAEDAIADAESCLARLAIEAEPNPRALEHTEERLFALRAAARKHSVPVTQLFALLVDLQARLAALEISETELANLTKAATAARARFAETARRLTAHRTREAIKLERAVGRELPPLRLDRARFVVSITELPEPDWGPHGADQVRFLIAANPGETPGPLGRVASGGELSRLMLALKVVLTGGGTIPTLIFDEVDSGIGGATAAAVGDRLARIANTVQILVVTHSPQVAARANAHWRVTKRTGTRARTEVATLDPTTRREEIARMLAGETITEAARAAAESLLGAA